MADPRGDLTAAGVSIWLDDLSRPLLRTGALQRLIDHSHVVGITSNPTIFANAIGGGAGYDDIEKLSRWASTGVKDPGYDDTRYVVDLVTPGVVNLTNATEARRTPATADNSWQQLNGYPRLAQGRRAPGRVVPRRRTVRRASAVVGASTRSVQGVHPPLQA